MDDLWLLYLNGGLFKWYVCNSKDHSHDGSVMGQCSISSCHVWFDVVRVYPKIHPKIRCYRLQGGPNNQIPCSFFSWGETTPINGRKYMGNWDSFKLLHRVITLLQNWLLAHLVKKKTEQQAGPDEGTAGNGFEGEIILFGSGEFNLFFLCLGSILVKTLIFDPTFFNWVWNVQHPKAFFPNWKFHLPIYSVFLEKNTFLVHCCPSIVCPRDPGSPSENGFMEPKYLAFRKWLYSPIIIWRSVSQDP